VDPYESRFQEKPNFQIKFKPPQKGGEVRLSTKETVRYEKDLFWEGSEEVLIEYQDVRIRADRARYDFRTKTATLEGHVVIDQGPTRLAGSRGVFQIETKTGSLEDASADLAPTYHVIARSIEKVGEATYRIRDGIFTSCDVPDPDWSFFLSEATVTLDDYARMKNVSFRAGRVPLLYTPYLIWPTREDRASGLLVPGIGYNSRRGAYLGTSYYWVTGRSTDATTLLDLYSKGSVGLGQELRWTPSPEAAGLFQGYGIRDTEATVCVPPAEAPEGGSACTLSNGRPGVFALRTRTRWKARVDHVSDDLPYDVRGVLSFLDYSDEQFLQDFERSFALSSARQIVSRGFLTKNLGDDSFNLRVERSETFFGTEVIQQRIPSLEYFRRTSRIGPTPLFLAAESSLSYLYLDRGPNLPKGSYGRFDLHPTLSLPWKQIPWLSVTAKASGRVTAYTDSIASELTRFEGEGVTRTYGEAGLSIVGPSFSRIYDAAIGPFGRFKHVIEPRVEYQYLSEVEDPARIPAYDEVDTPLGLNQIRYALINRLLARPADPKAGSASEVASLEIAQTYAFERPQPLFETPTAFLPRRTGPLEGVLRVAPGQLFQLDGRLSYDTRASQVTTTSVAASASWKANYVNATWFASSPVPVTPGAAVVRTDQIRFAAGLDVLPVLRLDTQWNYDVRQNLMLEDRSLVTYRGSCYEVFFELRQLRLPPETRRDYRVVFNLKDVGTLLDVRGSLDRIFQ
jgi:LPS-assembly protein